MTLAACYVAREGVVFGADSTNTLATSNSERFYDFGQKVLEVGKGSHLGVISWGRATFPSMSNRELIARFADSLPSTPVSVEKAATLWRDFFWRQYVRDFHEEILAVHEIDEKTLLSDRDRRRRKELVSGRHGGFCIGGIAPPNREPAAFFFQFSPTPVAPELTRVPKNQIVYWGQYTMLNRLLFSVDQGVLERIANSGKWTGTERELASIVTEDNPFPPYDLPLRDAIDWVHSAIQITIKAMKFSRIEPYCGGPIEIAVVTADRPFRWVRHKPLDSAIEE